MRNKYENSKNLIVPSWVEQRSLVGYTGRIDHWPSVYYTKGHVTSDHPDPDNIGWEGGRDWICLFFGNLPIRNSREDRRAYRRWVEHHFAEGHLARVSYCDRATQRWQRAIVEQANPTTILVELWDTPTGRFFHPSRGTFHWVEDLAMRRRLDGLARGSQALGNRWTNRHNRVVRENRPGR